MHPCHFHFHLLALCYALLRGNNQSCSAFNTNFIRRQSQKHHRQIARPPHLQSSSSRHHLSRSTSFSTLISMSSSSSSSSSSSAGTLDPNNNIIMPAKHRPFRIRTITAFVTLHTSDFDEASTATTTITTNSLADKIDKCNDILRTMEKSLIGAGYEVQTVRIATNPFGEWLTTTSTTSNNNKVVVDRLTKLNELLHVHDINFCSLGPSTNPHHTTEICPLVISMHPGRFSCSANIDAGDIDAASAAAKCMQQISTLSNEDVPNNKKNPDLTTDGNDSNAAASHVEGGLGNFRFCAASCVETVPFFPGAKAPPPSSDPNRDSFRFAIGLENGGFARHLLKEASTIRNIKHMFDTKMREELLPIQELCLKFANTATAEYPVEYLGIDTSLNPSLDEGGSVAHAIECLEEVRGDFGGTGSLAAAAAITTSLQSMPDILITGYSGLMLPVLEDERLAELGNMGSSSGDGDRLTIQKLLCISSVCGVGIDTVPIPGDVSEDALVSLLLDVAALAGRWNKPLSCRVFPVPGGIAGEKTTFDSPYMCNSCIFEL